jgi:hypothetical protein
MMGFGGGTIGVQLQVVERVGSENVIPSQNEAPLVEFREEMFITDSKIWRYTIGDSSRGEMIKWEQNLPWSGKALSLSEEDAKFLLTMLCTNAPSCLM